MHDIDRTQIKADHLASEYEEGEDELIGELLGEMESEDEGFLGNILGGLLGQGESEDEDETDGESDQFLGAIFGEAEMNGQGESADEVEEMELATELLEITDEAELDQFIGNLVQSAVGLVGKYAPTVLRAVTGGAAPASQAPTQRAPQTQRSPTASNRGGGGKKKPKVANRNQAQAVSTVGTKLKDIAWKAGEAGASKAAEWAVERLLTSVFGAGGAGGGAQELEGLSPEDREFEAARRFVRFGRTALRQAATTAQRAPAPVAVRAGMTRAARTHVPALTPVVIRITAPGAISSNGGGGGRRRALPRGGRWTRTSRGLVIHLD